MRYGIQTKLVTTLMLASLLPLALSLAVILFGVVRIRTDDIGGTFRSLARGQADHFSTLLSAQVETIWTLTHLPGTRAFVEEAGELPPPTPEQIEQIEQRWDELTVDDSPLADILTNPLAEFWRAVQARQPRFAEIMISDAHGRLVAASNKTSNYYQADELWWQQTYAEGRGRVFLSDIVWDESALSPEGIPGALVVNLHLPLYRGDPPDDRRVIGVMKASLDAIWLIGQLEGEARPDLPESRMWLVGGDGRPVIAEDQWEDLPVLPPRVMQQIRTQRRGWLRQTDLPERELIGFAAVSPQRGRLAAVEAEWYVIVAASRQAALGPVYRLVAIILLIGIALILFCFIGGLYVARREIVHPLLTLSRGVGELERGHIDYRLPAPPPGEDNDHFRDDEIGQLARDFNRMAERIRGHVDELERADRMKQQFIDVASHELRTPVTYLLGVTHLALRQHTAPAPLLAKISGKADRLSRIVENMFKLLQSGTYQAALRLGPVNLRELIEEVRQELEPFVQERRQRWDVQLDDELPFIQADAEKLRDILWNLFSNAVRFSPDGQSVSVRAAAVEKGLEVTVRDSGGGIPQTELPYLFDLFYTGSVPHHMSGEYQYLSRGIGLGLSVVKRFVDMHGGSIKVDSSPQGTAIRVFLPLHPPVEVAPTPGP